MNKFILTTSCLLLAVASSQCYRHFPDDFPKFDDFHLSMQRTIDHSIRKMYEEFDNVQKQTGRDSEASGHIGPSGGYGSARVFPDEIGSALSPRFGDEGPLPPSPNGFFKSVHSSTSSISKTINGQTMNKKDAFVEINDNGKVTTYSAGSP